MTTVHLLLLADSSRRWRCTPARFFPLLDLGGHTDESRQKELPAAVQKLRFPLYKPLPIEITSWITSLIPGNGR